MVYSMRWRQGIIAGTDKPKWHFEGICKSEPHATATRLLKWRQRAADAIYQKEQYLNGDAKDYVVHRKRYTGALWYIRHVSGHLQDSTVARHERALQQFNEYIDERASVDRMHGLRTWHIASFRDYMLELGYAAGTCNLRLSDISAWLQWALGESYVFDNVARNVNKVLTKETRAELPIVGAADMWAMLDELEPDIRARVGVMACTGMRRTEGGEMLWNAWDQDTNTLLVGAGDPRRKRTTKNHRRRIPVCPTVDRWIRHLRAVNTRGEYMLGLRMGEQRMNAQLNRWLEPWGMSYKHLRCWFRVALETVEAPQYVADDIMGHVTCSVRSAYTPQDNLEVARPVMARLETWLVGDRRE